MTVVVAADDTVRRRLFYASRLALGPASYTVLGVAAATEIFLKLTDPDCKRQTQASCIPSPSQTVTANPAVVWALSSLTVTHSYSPMATTSIAPSTRPHHLACLPSTERHASAKTTDRLVSRAATAVVLATRKSAVCACQENRK